MTNQVSVEEPVSATLETSVDDVTVDEVLVEEVSIDGMCGVY